LQTAVRMRIAELFIVRHDSGRGLFIAPQSLCSFPVAICIVATISRAARTIWHIESESIAVPIGMALATGAAIVAAILTDKDTRPRSVGEWIAAALIALLNSMVLFVAALGIE
jgi:hypothetical protein